MARKKWITEDLKPSGVCLSTSITTPHGDFEFLYPAETDSKEVVLKTTSESNVEVSPEEEAKMIETVEVAKYSWEEFEISIL